MKKFSAVLSGFLLLATTVVNAQIFTTVYNFDAFVSGTNHDGAQVSSQLLVGRDGDFYGTAYAGGTNRTGTVFKSSPSGAFKVVHTFSPTVSQTNSDGA